MCDQEKPDDYFSPEAIAARRQDEPAEVTRVWKRPSVTGGFRNNSSKHWDGKPKKSSDF